MTQLQNNLWSGIRWVIITVKVLLLLVGCRLADQWKRPIPTTTSVLCIDCVKLEVEMKKQIFTISEPITVTATLQKMTNKPDIVYTYQNSPMKNFEVTVLDKNGTEVSLTEEGIDAKWGDPSSFRIIQNITPTYPFSETFDITNWFQMVQTGTYTLIIEKNVYDEASNIINLAPPPLTFTLTTD